jgi:hypothetical protein
MPKAKEFSVRIEDEPGTLAKVCRALADGNVNILAFQLVPLEEEEGLVRFVVDNSTKAKSVLDKQKFKYKEMDVAQVKLPNRPGELARAASELSEADINIKYAYCGGEADRNASLLIFGVADVGRAVKILDKATAAAAGA